MSVRALRVLATMAVVLAALIGALCVYFWLDNHAGGRHGSLPAAILDAAPWWTPIALPPLMAVPAVLAAIVSSGPASSRSTQRAASAVLSGVASAAVSTVLVFNVVLVSAVTDDYCADPVCAVGMDPMFGWIALGALVLALGAAIIRDVSASRTGESSGRRVSTALLLLLTCIPVLSIIGTLGLALLVGRTAAAARSVAGDQPTAT